MSINANELPQDAALLRELVLRQQCDIEKRDDELRILREYIRLLKHHRFERKCTMRL